MKPFLIFFSSLLLPALTCAATEPRYFAARPGALAAAKARLSAASAPRP